MYLFDRQNSPNITIPRNAKFERSSVGVLILRYMRQKNLRAPCMHVHTVTEHSVFSTLCAHVSQQSPQTDIRSCTALFPLMESADALTAHLADEVIGKRTTVRYSGATS